MFNQAKDERNDTILNVKARNHDFINTILKQANDEKQTISDGGRANDMSPLAWRGMTCSIKNYNCKQLKNKVKY